MCKVKFCTCLQDRFYTVITPDDFSDLHQFAGDRKNKTKNIHWALLDLNGKSQVTNNKDVTQSPQKAMVHNQVHPSHFSSDLQQIIDRWDNLPGHIKTAIQALVKPFSGESK